MNEEIIAYRDKKLSILADDELELNHFVTSDEARADDYAGREIFELLQNAIDVGDNVMLRLNGDTLTVSNTGTPFNVDNIKSLMIPDNSTKRDLDNFMGCKGVGFRASLNVSDDISIYSGEIHLNFSKKNALNFQQIYNLSQMPPMMRCPVIVDEKYISEYTTNIVIKLRDEDQIERIRNQIEEIGPNTILFLKDSLSYLKTEVNGTVNTYHRTINKTTDGEMLVTVTHNGESLSFREFYEDIELDNPNRPNKTSFRLSAIYSPNSISYNKLFSFFPTDIDFPMEHWYVHGEFNLTNNRNYLVKDSFNRILMESLLRLLCKSAQKLSADVDYVGYKSLVSHGSFSDSILKDTDINDMLDELITDSPIVPTVHGEYIPLNSRPVFYDHNFQQYLLDMPGNEKLLQYTKDSDVVDSLNSESQIEKYPFFQVCDHLNNCLDDLTAENRAECALLLHRYYNNIPDSVFRENAPNFFLDRGGDTIENGSILIESSGEKQIVLPKFVDLKYINEKQLALIKAGTDSFSDTLFTTSRLAAAYGIKIANIDEILDVIDAAIKDSKDLIPDYVRWLFDNKDTIEKTSHGNFYILTKNRSIRRSDSSYFGKDYIKGTQLDRFYDSSKIIAKPSVFHIRKNEMGDFTSFLKNRLKVADEPRNVDGSIDGLERILKAGSTKYIINLICDRSQLLKVWKNSNDSSRTIRTTPWITKKGKRYAPANVILTSKKTYRKINDYIDDDFLFISQDELLAGNKLESSEKTWLLSEYLNIGTDLNDLNNHRIYKILNTLPSFDLNGEISEDAYKDIIERNNDREKPSIVDDEFEKFVNSGKVFCLDRKYHPVSDCRYLEKNYPNIISSKYNCISITKGRSASAIFDRLHVKDLSINYELNDYKRSNLNNTEHENNIKSIKTNLLVDYPEQFRDENLLKKLARTNIILCEFVTIAYDKENGPLDDYEFVSRGDDYFIKIPSRGHSDFKKLNYSEALSGIFKMAFSFTDKNSTSMTALRDEDARIEKAKDEHGGNAWADALEKLNYFSIEDNDYSSENDEILLNLRDYMFGEYEHRLYSKVINAPLEEKESYVDQLMEYKNYRFSIDDIPKKKNANMRSYLFGVFPIFNEKIVIEEDINQRRNDCYEKLSEEFVDYKDYLDRLLDNPRFESLLRFGEIETIREEILKIIDKLNMPDKKQSTNVRVSRDSIDVDEGADSGHIIDIATEEENAINDAPNSPAKHRRSTAARNLQDIRGETIDESSDGVIFVDFDDVKPKRQSSVTQSTVRRQRYMSTAGRKAQEERAKKAEKIALEELKKRGYSNIQWMSAYAKDEGVNPNGADGYGYDILCEKDGSVRYVEVKSSQAVTGIEFEMSENEYNYCCQHPKNYDIFYVFAMNAATPEMTLIENVYHKITDENKVAASYRISIK